MMKPVECLVVVLFAVRCASTDGTADINDSLEFDFKLLNVPTWSALFSLNHLNMTMKQTRQVQLTISYIDPLWGEDFELHVLPQDDYLLRITDGIVTSKQIPSGATTWTGNVSVEAVFLGQTSIYVELRRPHMQPERAIQTLEVVIMRNMGVMDVVFKISVGCFVLLLYTTFGTALELDVLKRILLCPVGPVIGFVTQFLIMPVLSFLIGYVCFRDMIELRLGLFFTGATPGGGASNIFTVILNGNLNLSITMTALSNLAAFGMMPLWIFTLGALIFHDGKFAIPYETIASMSVSLVVPLTIGILLQKYAPNLSKTMARYMKSFALFLMIVMTIFAFSINSYIFKLFTWQILLASIALPWIGYLLGWIVAKVCGQSPQDALTIAIETGIQNTGIAIFMLNFTLPQPQADITSAVPVATAMMTPLPLLAIYFIRKLFRRTSIEEVEEAPTKEAKTIEVEAIMQKDEQKANQSLDSPS